MLLFEKDFPNMAAQRYEMNDGFFVELFSEPEMMKMVMETVGGVVYERLKKRKTYEVPARPLGMVAEQSVNYGDKADQF